MPTAVVHSLSNEFDERNLFFQVTLGMISLTRRLRVVLDCEAATTVIRDEGPDRYAEVFLHFVLGLASFSSRLMDHLEHAGPRRRERRAATEAPPLTGPLRHLLV